jgi:hypothetical protein
MELNIYCPISYEIMQDPVILVETGQTYEKSNILKWLSSDHMTDPITGCKLKDDASIIPNIVMRQHILNLGHVVKENINNIPFIIKNDSKQFNSGIIEYLDSNSNLITNFQLIEDTYGDIRVRHKEMMGKYEPYLNGNNISKLQKERDEEILNYIRINNVLFNNLT